MAALAKPRVILFMFFMTLVGCQVNDGSRLQSILGLEAGQDSAIRKAKAQVFIVLSDWFQGFKGSATSTGTNSLSASLPPKSLNVMRAYLQDQIQRHDAFEQALQRRDEVEVKRLLDLETREMKDIALALLSDSSEWQPPTGDKLAKLIVASRRHSDFADTFATKGFLEVVFATSSVAGLINGLEAQRQEYLAALIARYTGDASRQALLKTRLDQDRQVIAALLASLNQAGGAGLALIGNQPAINGQVGFMLSFLVNGNAEAARRQQIQASAAARMMQLAGYSEAEFSLSGDSDEATLKKNSQNTLDAENTSYSVFFDEAAPDLSIAAAASEGSNRPSDSSKKSNNSKKSKNSEDQLVDEKDFRNIMNQSASTDSKLSTPYAAESTYDCSGLKGNALVGCQRYLAHTKPFVEPNVPTRSSFSYLLDNSKGSSNGNTALLKAFLVEGALDDNSGDISKQGSLPSCTQHGLHSYLRMRLRQLGVEPNSILASSSQEINSIFQGVQGSNMIMTAAVSAAKRQYSGKLNIDGKVIDWNTGRDVMTTTGRPLYLAIKVDKSWMANGGGDEFKLNSSLSTLSCAAGSSNHVVSVVGFIGNDPIIQNSWGSSWQHGGLALIDGNSCMGAGSYLYDLDVSVSR